MNLNAQGELVPIGGGDPIPLNRSILTIGRRESCDICLKFSSISGMHCELTFKDGYWCIRDLGSTNGIKVNGTRVLQRPLRPGDEVAIANRRYTIQYHLGTLEMENLEVQMNEDEDIHSMSLMEKAGLAKRRSRQDDDD